MISHKTLSTWKSWSSSLSRTGIAPQTLLLRRSSQRQVRCVGRAWQLTSLGKVPGLYCTVWLSPQVTVGERTTTIQFLSACMTHPMPNRKDQYKAAGQLICRFRRSSLRIFNSRIERTPARAASHGWGICPNNHS